MDFLKYRIPIIIVTLLLTGVVGYQIKNITVFHDLDRFVPKHRDDLKFLDKFNTALEPDDNYYMVAVASDSPTIFNSDFIKKTITLSKKIQKVDLVTKVTTPATIQIPIKTPFGMSTVPLLSANSTLRDTTKIRNEPRVYGTLVSRDYKSLGLYIKTDRDLDQHQLRGLDAGIKEAVNGMGFEKVYFAGKANVQNEFEALIKDEIVLYISLCLGLLFIVLVFVFRKPVAIIIALVSVIIGAVIFMGFLGILGKPLNLMSMLFPPLMLIVGISDIVHFFTNFSHNINEGADKESALRTTIKEIGWATLLTSLTTSVGFGALIFSQIEPIKEFGWTAAIGVFIAYLVVLFFTTSVMSLIPTRFILIKKDDKGDFWDHFMKQVFFIVINNKRTIQIITIIVLVFSIFGTFRISTNAYLLSDVPDESKLMEDVRYFETDFSGIRNFELAITPKRGHKIDDYAVLKEVDKVEKYLTLNHAINGISSPATVYKVINKASKGNSPKHYTLHTSQSKFKRDKKLAKRLSKASVNKVQNNEVNIGRMTGLMIDIGSDNVRQMNRNIDDWIKSNINQDLVTFRPTGKALLIDNNNKYLRSSIVQSLAIALVIVCILMGLLYKDIKMVFISLVPNLIPLLFAAAIIGLVGVELKAATSIVFAIAFGIAVDDTIHFLTKYKIEHDKGLSVIRSVFNTYLETGKAIILTTVILFFGFSMLCFSSFKPIFYIGFLLSVTFIAALLSCLFVMPQFIIWIMNRKEALDDTTIKKYLKDKLRG